MFFGHKKINDCNSEFKVIIDNQIITKVDCVKFLGVYFDCKLTWHQHVNYISNKLSKSIYIINRLRNKLPCSTLLSIYYSLFYSHINYCIILWGSASKTNLNKLVVLQKRAVRIITNSSYLCHTDPIFQKHKLIKLSDLYKYACLIFVFKYKLNLLPIACQSLLTLNMNNAAIYNLRRTNDFTIPSFRTNLRKKCIKISGPNF